MRELPAKQSPGRVWRTKSGQFPTFRIYPSLSTRARAQTAPPSTAFPFRGLTRHDAKEPSDHRHRCHSNSSPADPVFHLSRSRQTVSL